MSQALAHGASAARPGLMLADRVAHLRQAFELVQHTRMQGVPLLNPALWVEAVEFEPCPAGLPGSASASASASACPLAPDSALGVLITPWFMNLVLLPLQLDVLAEVPVGASVGYAHADLWQVGQAQARTIGNECFEFIGAHEPSIGAYAACSLFSPMFDFANQAVARATAQAVLASLRSRPGESRPVTASAVAAKPEVPARRAFLFGRSPS